MKMIVKDVYFVGSGNVAVVYDDEHGNACTIMQPLSASECMLKGYSVNVTCTVEHEIHKREIHSRIRQLEVLAGSLRKLLGEPVSELKDWYIILEPMKGMTIHHAAERALLVAKQNSNVIGMQYNDIFIRITEECTVRDITDCYDRKSVERRAKKEM